MNDLAEVCLVGLELGVNYANALSYYITYICYVTLQAFTATIHPIWFNVNID